MIQVLTYSGRETSFKEKEFTLNSLHDAQSLDEFDVNQNIVFDYLFISSHKPV